MICKECGFELSEDMEFCPNCETSINKDNIKKISNNKSRHSGKLKKISIILIALISISSMFYSYTRPEQKAKRVANRYFSAMKHNRDTWDYKSPEVEDFNHLLNYEYLGTSRLVKVENTFRYTKETYHLTDEGFASYQEAKEHWKKLFTSNPKNKVLVDNDKVLEIWLDFEYLNQYHFIYDVHFVANNGLIMSRKVLIKVREGSYGKYEVISMSY